METKEISKKREWVKNAAIIFLAVLLLLTFLSNTILNSSLPEVATREVTGGSITARIRVTGTVSANQSYEVSIDESRRVQSVMVRSGQEVQAGDVLFVLSDGAGEELEAAQDTLRALQKSYQEALINAFDADYSRENLDIRRLREDLAEKRAERAALDDTVMGLLQARAALSAAEQAVAAQQQAAGAAFAAVEAMTPGAEEARAEAISARAEADRLTQELADAEEESGREQMEAALQEAESALAIAENALAAAEAELSAALEAAADAEQALAAAEADRAAAEDALAGLEGTWSEYEARRDALDAEIKSMSRALEDALLALQTQQKNDGRQVSLENLNLQELATQVARQQKRVDELGENATEQEVTAPVGGVIQDLMVTAGQTTIPQSPMATIELPDMGYTMSASVTNDQARRVHTGDVATAANMYWGTRIDAVLTDIKADPRDPQNSKLLTFELSGDVTPGASLTLSVGERSADYDYVVPGNAIRSDANGDFLLIVSAKNSPLGDRYTATRVNVTKLATDDTNVAVSGALNFGDFVITTSTAPIKNGDRVRLADAQNET